MYTSDNFASSDRNLPLEVGITGFVRILESFSGEFSKREVVKIGYGNVLEILFGKILK